MDENSFNSIGDEISMDFFDCNQASSSSSSNDSLQIFCDDEFENLANFTSFSPSNPVPKENANLFAYVNEHCRFRKLPESQLAKREVLTNSSVKVPFINSKKVVPNIKDPKTWLAINASGEILQNERNSNGIKQNLALEDFLRRKSSDQNSSSNVEFKEDRVLDQKELSKVETKVEKLLEQCRCDAVSFLQIYCSKYKQPPPQYAESVGHLSPTPSLKDFGYFYSVKLGSVKYSCKTGSIIKKNAKQMAAKIAMSSLLTMHPIFSQITDVEDLKNALFFVKKTKPVNVCSTPLMTSVDDVCALPRSDLFAKIGRLITEKFQEIVSNDTYSLQENVPKVFAGFCLHNSITDSLQVICMTTGNQCITGDKICLNGTVLNDCHAEILAKRCLVRYIYARLMDQLQLDTMDDDDDRLFEKTENKIFKLKERYSFHLYISTAPCGDGRQFTFSDLSQPSQRNPSQSEVHSPSFLIPRKNGLLRCKIEKGEGGVLIPDDILVQTIGGINAGERLYTMSCSDKILKWNVLGLQGTLLASLIDPIYLASLTVGSLYHPGHLSRAICCRLTDLIDLPDPYRVNHPLIGQGGIDAGRDIRKKKAICFDWIDIDVDKFERLDGGKGRTLADQKSRLCKSEIFSLYKSLKQKLSSSSNDIVMNEFYIDAKMKNENYQRAKKIFVKTIQDKNYGVWLNKPIEEKQF